MTTLPITLTAAGVAALINFWLSWRIAQLRQSENIWVGDGGNDRLVARMRAQLNFAEYAPLTLILFGLVEAVRGSPHWLWAAAAVFLVGRILHAFGMDGWKLGRSVGMAFTAPVMVGLAIYALKIAWLG